MSERLLAVLLQQAVLLSLGVVLMAASRPLLLRRLGAGSVYAAWLLVPALLLTPLLPRPAQEPLRVVMQATGTLEAVSMPALPAPPASHAALWLGLWLAGSAVVALVQAARQWRLARLGPRLPAGSSPALVGLLHPRVALPADFEQRFSPVERELILAHEQVHRQRGDNAWNLLACALAAMHWWNPLAWWAARRLQADQELACDAAVLSARPDALADYTRALLAAHALTPHGAPLASRWGSSHPLVERIAMLQQPRTRLSRRVTGLTLLATVALIAAGAVNALTSKDDHKPTVDVQVKASLVTTAPDGMRDTREASMTVRLKAGEPGRVLLSQRPNQPASDQISVEFTATPLADQRILVAATLQRGDPLVTFSSPRIVTANGVKALIESGRDDPTVKELFRLEVTPTLTAQATQ